MIFNLIIIIIIWNAYFIDEIKLYLWQNDGMKKVPLKKHGIAWPTDKSVKFRNPKGQTLQEGNFIILFITVLF